MAHVHSTPRSQSGAFSVNILAILLATGAITLAAVESYLLEVKSLSAQADARAVIEAASADRTQRAQVGLANAMPMPPPAADAKSYADEIPPSF